MSKPKAEHKKWMQTVAEYAEAHGSFPKQESNQFQIHHVKGRAFKHNKVAIGHWLILPIEPRFHDVMSDNPWNVTHFPKRYAVEFNSQVSQFVAMCAVMRSEGLELPFGDDVMHAIQDLNV